jgi:predicted SAM-dependent methyltransferase
MKAVVKKIFALFGLEIRRKIVSRNLEVPVNAKVSSRFDNYHLGCGKIIADNFLNIDQKMNVLNRETGKAVNASELKGENLLEFDLRNGIPAEPSSLKVIYHSHFLEHLSNEESMVFLRDCLQCLSKGGTMRIAVPDLELWCREYLSGKPDFFEWYQDTYLGDWWDSSDAKGITFCGMLYNWGHKMAYDYESLCARLLDIGFVDVERKAWGESERVPSVSTLESHNSQRRIESLVIECRKPH